MSTRSGFIFYPPQKVFDENDFCRVCQDLLDKMTSGKEERRKVLFEIISLVRSNRNIVNKMQIRFIVTLVFKMNELNTLVPSDTLASIIKEFDYIMKKRLQQRNF